MATKRKIGLWCLIVSFLWCITLAQDIPSVYAGGTISLQFSSAPPPKISNVRVGNVTVVVSGYEPTTGKLTINLPSAPEPDPSAPERRSKSLYEEEEKKLLGGVYYVFVNDNPEPSFKLNVWGDGYITAESSKYPRPSRLGLDSNRPQHTVETLLFKLCNYKQPSQNLTDQDRQTFSAKLTEALQGLQNNLNGAAIDVTPIGPARFVPPDEQLKGATPNCQCVLVEHDFLLRRKEIGEVVIHLKSTLVSEKFKLKTFDEIEVSPLIYYSLQTHYGAHPGPDHELVPELYRDDNYTGKDWTGRDWTIPEWRTIPLELSSRRASNAIESFSLRMPTVGGNSPDSSSSNNLVAVLDSGFKGDNTNTVPFEPNGLILLSQRNYDKEANQAGYGGFKDKIFFDDDSRPSEKGELLHGTPIARIIGRLAPQASLLPVKVCNDGDEKNELDSICTETNIIRGICYALSQANLLKKNLILNLSFSNYNWSPILRDVLSDAAQQSAIIVAASGNSRKPALAFEQGAVTFPAGYGIRLPVRPGSLSSPPSVAVTQLRSVPSILGVGSVHLTRSRAEQWAIANTSIRGLHVTVAAPGRRLLVDEQVYSGTSFAAAFVSGYLAALPSRFPRSVPASNVVQCVTDTRRIDSAPLNMARGIAATRVEVGVGRLRIDVPPVCPPSP